MATITARRLREAAELLGIRNWATLNEIRARYSERVKEWHPDVSQNDPAESHEMTIRVNYPALQGGASCFMANTCTTEM